MTNQQLESDLREAFSVHARGIPGDAAARLGVIDYRPRASRISPRITVGALAGVAATTGAVVSAVVFGSAQAAFAGWSPSPTPLVSAGQTSTADTACQAQIAAAPGISDATAGSGWSPVATDVRGPFTLVLYQDGTARATCLTGPSITVVSRSSGSGGSVAVSGSASGASGRGSRTSTMIGNLTSGSIEEMSVVHLASTSQGAFTVVTGQVEAGVTGVTLVRNDGEQVQTSVSDGLFMAWWPGTGDATAAEITTARGVTTQTLKAAPLPPAPGSGSCDAGSQATSTSGVCSGGTGDGGSAGPSVGVAG